MDADGLSPTGALTPDSRVERGVWGVGDVEVTDVRLGEDVFREGRAGHARDGSDSESRKALRVAPGAGGDVRPLMDEDPCTDPNVIIPPPECDDHGGPGGGGPGDPPPDEWYIYGESYVEIWGWGDFVTFGSWTAATKPVSSISVAGLSLIDDIIVVNGGDSAHNATFAGIEWTYQAWRDGYGQKYQQRGTHQVDDSDLEDPIIFLTIDTAYP